MKLGYLDIGDGAGIEASLEDDTLTLSGSLEGGGGGDAFGPRAQLASLRSGLILPLYGEDDDAYPMTELDGLYELGQVGYEYSPGVPWAMTLRRLAAGSVLGEVSALGKMLPTVSPVTFSTTFPRVGVPGDIDTLGPSVVADLQTDLTEGRVHTVTASASAQRWMSFRCEPSEWLAGSPRIEIEGGGTWWPIHGQPPAGVPVRVHNGMVGLRLPTGGQGLATLRVDTTGAVDRTYPVGLSDSGGYIGVRPAAGVEVVRADTEMVWVRWTQQRANLAATRQTNGVTTDCVIRRGMPGLTVSMSKQMDLTVSATNNGVYQDSASNTIGAVAGDLTFASQRVVTVSGTSTTRIAAPQVWRVGTDGWRTRAWAAPSISVLR